MVMVSWMLPPILLIIDLAGPDRTEYIYYLTVEVLKQAVPKKKDYIEKERVMYCKTNKIKELIM